MKVVVGNKLEEMDKQALDYALSGYTKVVIDLGTGDGRFVYGSAKQNRRTFFIGIDLLQKQMAVYANKCLREKIPNALFAIGSVENLPQELANTADEVHIILPWGTLMQKIVQPKTEVVKRLGSILKVGGRLEILFGYHPDFEPSEAQRLNLAELDESYIRNTVLPTFEDGGFEVIRTLQLDKNALGNVQTTWSKKLAFGKKRPIYRFELTKRK